MPEAAVHEDCYTSLRKDYVGLSSHAGDWSYVDAKSEPVSVKRGSQCPLWCGVAGGLQLHPPADCGGRGFDT